MKIPKGISKKWITSLLNGQYKQHMGNLRTKNKFCCLGVLCDLVDHDGWTPVLSMKSDHPEYTHGGRHGLPNPSVWKLAGFKYNEKVINFEGALAELNDAKAPFELIAGTICSELGLNHSDFENLLK